MHRFSQTALKMGETGVKPVSVGRNDIEALRLVGFDDTAILQINLIASWFNYINRVADGLGVGRE